MRPLTLLLAPTLRRVEGNEIIDKGRLPTKKEVADRFYAKVNGLKRDDDGFYLKLD